MPILQRSALRTGLLLVIAISGLAACTDETGASGPDLTSVGFDTAGTKCEISEAASTFPRGVRIHAVLTMEPALPTGGTVIVSLEKDGTEIIEARQTLTMPEPAPCVYGTYPVLEPGHYRVSYAISPGQMPPATGEFDVTP